MTPDHFNVVIEKFPFLLDHDENQWDYTVYDIDPTGLIIQDDGFDSKKRITTCHGHVLFFRVPNHTLANEIIEYILTTSILFI